MPERCLILWNEEYGDMIYKNAYYRNITEKAQNPNTRKNKAA